MARMKMATRTAADTQIRMNDEYDEAQAIADREHATFLAGGQRQMELNDDYDEAEFLIAEAERLMKAEAEAAKAQSRLCRCGCGETPVGKSARFIPGHDGRLKGRLLKEARSEDVNVSASAIEQLRSFGWIHFLVETTKAKKKREAAERRAAKAAEEEGTPVPTPSALTAEDRLRIQALRQREAASGIRNMTSRQTVNA